MFQLSQCQIIHWASVVDMTPESKENERKLHYKSTLDLFLL